MYRKFRGAHLHPYDSIDKEKHYYDKSYMRESLKKRKKETDPILDYYCIFRYKSQFLRIVTQVVFITVL